MVIVMFNVLFNFEYLEGWLVFIYFGVVLSSLRCCLVFKGSKVYCISIMLLLEWWILII